MQNKVVFIVGPTGVGKTNLAFSLAQEFDADLVSADSIQVYKGLDIVSGKDLPKTAKYISLPELSQNGYNTSFYIDRGRSIFLLDVVEPTSSFSVSNFQDAAFKALDHIFQKNKLPIVVGGTGLYVKSLLEPIDTASVKPNIKLRNRLEKLSVEELQRQLPEEKLKTFNDSDKNNPRRLIRAIEIHSQGTDDREQGTKRVENKFENLVVGLTCDRETLRQRIDDRVDARLEQGAIVEVTKLFEIYESLAPQIKDANGYKQLFQFLQGAMSLEEAIYRWKISEYRHAKNQMTWFRKYGNTQWFDVSKKGYKKDIAASLKKFLS